MHVSVREWERNGETPIGVREGAFIAAPFVCVCVCVCVCVSMDVNVEGVALRPTPRSNPVHVLFAVS